MCLIRIYVLLFQNYISSTSDTFGSIMVYVYGWQQRVNEENWEVIASAAQEEKAEDEGSWGKS